jgi:hypothetical protein
VKLKEMKRALACAALQQKWCKQAALALTELDANPRNKVDAGLAVAGMNQSRYFRRCALNLRVAIAAHRGRHPGGSGRMFGIRAWNRRRRKVARRIALEANRTFWRTV